jgi:hypothetical protein
VNVNQTKIMSHSKRLLLLTTTFFLFLTFSVIDDAHSQGRPGNTELGIILGEPTGISFKSWQSGTSAFDLALAWSFGRNGAIYLHANYLKHHPQNVTRGTFYLYYGLGARTILQDDPRFGARVPLGLQYIIPDSRLTFFFEVSPILDLAPATRFGVGGGVGIRYFL